MINRYIKYFIVIIFVLLFFSCLKNKTIPQNGIVDLDVNETQNSIIDLDINYKGTRKIIDNENNKYLGYLDLIKEKNKDPPNNLWIAGIYVYEKYIISQLSYAYDPVGITVYNNVKNMNYNDLKDDYKLYNTYEHYLMGIYDDYLFLLNMGYSPTVRDFKIVELKTNRTIYEGDYIWKIGINFIEQYIIEIYEKNSYTIMDNNIEKYTLNKYLLNLITGEKIDMNTEIEIIGE